MNPESAVAQLAASILVREVDATLLASLQEPATAAVLKQIEPAAGELLERDWTEADFDDAAVEYCRLFILTPAAPARAVAYDETKGNEVAGRIQFMLDSGFLELPEHFATLTPDHVALLLLVASSLSGDDYIQFRKDNLFWLGEFTEKLGKASSHPIYQLVGKIVRVM